MRRDLVAAAMLAALALSYFAGRGATAAQERPAAGKAYKFE